MSAVLRAEAREGNTKGDRNRLRTNGKVPAVIYGKSIPQIPIAIEQKDLLAQLRVNPHAIIDLEVPQMGKQSVMIQEVQRDPVSRQLLHVDFHQINMNEPVNTVVRLEFTGEAEGVKAGGILQIQRHELEIRCLPNEIPASIAVDVSHLTIGHNLLVSDVKLPGQIQANTDENEVLATILIPQKADEETVEAAEAAVPKAESSES